MDNVLFLLIEKSLYQYMYIVLLGKNVFFSIMSKKVVYHSYMSFGSYVKLTEGS